MGNSGQTLSERLFEEFCDANRLTWFRVPTQPNTPTPDYELRLPNDTAIVCEVKQLEPNSEDVAEIRKAIEGKGAGRWLAPRFRSVIDSRQLRGASESGRPTMLVVYDNTPFKAYSGHLDVLQAMFGQYSVTVSFDQNDAHTVSEPYFGARRKMTASTNRSISALAVLEGAPSRLLLLRVYHNPFATVRLSAALLNSSSVIHHLSPPDDNERQAYEAG